MAFHPNFRHHNWLYISGVPIRHFQYSKLSKLVLSKLRTPLMVPKESACSAGDTGDMGSIPRLERSPGEGNGNPLHCSCLKNPTDREAYSTQSCKEFYTTEQISISSVQSLSRVQLFATPWIGARQASLSLTKSQSSLRFTSIESVMPIQPSHPMSSPSAPAPNPSQHQSLFQWVHHSIIDNILQPKSLAPFSESLMIHRYSYNLFCPVSGLLLCGSTSYLLLW